MGIVESWWIPIWFLVSLGLLVAASRWFVQHLLGVSYLITGRESVAGFVYFAVMLPGILIHELSHYLLARLLGLQAGSMELWPKANREGLSLGSVRVQKADPLRNSLVGLAPLLAGTLILFLVGRRVFGLEAWMRFFDTPGLDQLRPLLHAAVQVPDFWLWTYLVFATANSMLPSKADRHAWRELVLYAGLLLVVYGIVRGSFPALSGETLNWLANWMAKIAAAFSLALIVDCIFGIILLIAELVVRSLQGRRFP